jgi:hypothetical protein
LGPSAIIDYDLFFTSGMHRLGGFCLLSKPPKLEGWGGDQTTPSRPPRTALPLANALRDPSRPPFLRLASSSSSPCSLLLGLDKLVPRRSSSNPFLARWGWGEAGGAPRAPARGARAPGPRAKNGQGPLHRPYFSTSSALRLRPFGNPASPAGLWASSPLGGGGWVAARSRLLLLPPPAIGNAKGARELW